MITIVAALALPLLAMTGGCPAPVITAAGIQSTHVAGDIRHTNVAITVTNHGAAEPSSYLQSVEVYQDGTKVDQKSVPTLKAGSQATVMYDFQRSDQARANSTHLRLQLVGHDAHAGAGDACPVAAAPFQLNV